MPAVSKAQQAFMAMASKTPDKLRAPAPDMTKGQMRDFAATPTKGLPDKVAAKPASKLPAAPGEPDQDDEAGARAKRVAAFEKKFGNAKV